MMLSRLISVCLVVGACGIIHTGCSGGSSGGGGGAVPPSSSGRTETEMLDVRTGASASSATNSQMPAVTFFGADNHQYTLTIDTTPSGEPITLVVGRINSSGATQIITNEQTTTPDTRVFAPAFTGEGLYIVSATTVSGQPVEFSTVTCLASNQNANTTSFTVVLHFAGDAFTSVNRQQLLGEIVNAANSRLSSTGVQINLAASGERGVDTATVQGLNSSLVNGGGNTFLNSASLDAQTSAWTTALGIPASDPTFGNSLDVVICEIDTGSPGNTAIDPALRASIFTGNGPGHGIVIGFADSGGNSRSTSALGYILAHEAMHALGLLHTTDANLSFDASPDTPHAEASAYDTNGNGVFESTEASSSHPDFNNLLYPYADTFSPPSTTVSPHQAAIMRSYLAVQEH